MKHNGRARPLLPCGCSRDGLRCAAGETLWQAMQAAGRATRASRRDHANDAPDWPAYMRAREAYLQHVSDLQVIP